MARLFVSAMELAVRGPSHIQIYLLPVSILVLVGCRYDLDTVEPPCADRSECSPGQSCLGGRCVTASTDSTIVDSAQDAAAKEAGTGEMGLDASAEGGGLDLTVDQAVKDGPAMDAAKDAPQADAAKDAPQADAAMDAPQADAAMDAPQADAGPDQQKADLFLSDAKPPPTGWASHVKNVNTLTKAFAESVAVDQAGSIYVAGYFDSDIIFQGSMLSLTSKGDRDLYVAKLNKSGAFQWAVAAQSASASTCYITPLDIDVDNASNIYVVGSFSNCTTGAKFGGTTLTQTGSTKSDIFVAKLDSAGSFKWVKMAGGYHYDSARGVAVDRTSGDTYIAGHFNGTVKFGTVSKTSKGYSDIYVARLNTNGAFMWVTSAGGSSEDGAYDIALDDTNSHVYVTGSFPGSATFGTKMLQVAGYPASSMTDMFVAKLETASGGFKWATSGGGTSSDAGYTIDVSKQFICAAGTFDSASADFGGKTLKKSTSSGRDAFVTRLDDKGSFVWANSGELGSSGSVNGLAVDSTGNSTIVGGFLQKYTFGGLTSKYNVGYNTFVVRVDPAGNYIWATNTTGMAKSGRAVALNTSGAPIIVGNFMGTSKFGNVSLTAVGWDDGYIWQLGP
jgi:hypothetical protein